MRKFFSPFVSIASLLAVLDLSGCGNSGNQTQNKAARLPVLPPAPVAAPAAPNPTNANTPKEPAKEPKAARKVALPPNTDPKDLFSVGSEGEKMVLEPAVNAPASDQFAVALANVDVNSSDFVVATTPPSKVKGPKSGFTVPKGFVQIQSAGYSADGLPLRIHCEKTGTDLALVPGGGSVVGSDDGPEISQPQFKVRLDPFYMEILEVTVDSFEKFRAEMKEKKKTPSAPSNLKGNQSLPVLGATWGAAQAYARWAGMELPTEAEFEKAARGPNGFKCPWGDGKALNAERTITKGGSVPEDSSPYGIVDLAGNASEWCVDFYSPTSHKEAVSAAAKDVLHNWAGPKLSKDSKQRVVKGNGPDWSGWYREGRDIAKGHPDVGFRCVLRIPK